MRLSPWVLVGIALIAALIVLPALGTFDHDIHRTQARALLHTTVAVGAGLAALLAIFQSLGTKQVKKSLHLLLCAAVGFTAYLGMAGLESVTASLGMGIAAAGIAVALALKR